MYFMQQGTPFIYQGQEIVMTNVKFNSIDDYDDVKGINIYNELIANGSSIEEALKQVWSISRDNARTPMQWNNTENAGFSDAKPWIGVNENYSEINVEDQLKDKNSILNFYKKIIKLKKSSEALIYGKYELILEDHDQIYSYMRIHNEEKYIVICNLSNETVNYNYNDVKLNFDDILISNYKVNKHSQINNFDLKPWECRLYKINN